MKAKITLLFLLAAATMMAQVRVNGVVSDAGNEPIIGASVLEKGTQNGTVTDMDGFFSLQVSNPNAVLVISYVGMENREEALKGRTDLRISLSENTEVLEDVVVIGYGTAKRKDITTAVSSVNADNIEKSPITSAAQAIQGKAAGVTVMKPNGQPGTDMVIRVRGTTSMTASNDPLYVVDGVPMTDISFLAPNDIENMQILKDASSAAIYGSRAANGVIMITTKAGSASKDRTKVAFTMYGGWTQVTSRMKSLNTEQYKEYLLDLEASGQNVPVLPDGLTDQTNWFDETYKTGNTQNYQLSVSGGTDKVNYFLSGGYTTEKGIVESTSYKRYNFRSSIEAKMTNWLKVGANVAYSYSDKAGGISTGTGANRGGLVLSVLATPTYAPIYDYDNPNWYYTNFYGASNITHPLENIERYRNQHNYAHRLLATGKGVVTMYDTKAFGRADKYNHSLTYTTTFTEDYRATHYTNFLDPEKTSWGRNQYGEGNDNRAEDLVTVWDNVINYDLHADKHSFNAMIGTSWTHSMYTNNWISGSHYANGDIQTLNAANKINQSTGSGASEWAIMSAFARVSYNYDSRYIVSANMRADGSSKLAPGHKWGFFPSVSAAWRISGEHFMQDVNWIDDLKIRGGWGQTGNQAGLGDYAYLERYGISKQNWWETGKENAVPTYYQSSLRSTDLTWETTSQANVGFDWTMLKNRLTLNFDWYYKTTNNMLMWVDLPEGSAAVSSIQRNEGSMLNTGVEFTVDAHAFQKKNFTWDINFNISHNKNKLLSLETSQVYYAAEIQDIVGGAKVVRNTPGMPLGVFYGYKTNGVDPETGELNYVDLNGDGKITASDRTYIGDPNPDITYGMTNSFSFYGVTISFLLQGAAGGDIFNASRIFTEGMQNPWNQSDRVLDRWRRPGMITDIPKAGFDIKVSDYFVEDGSYLRLKDLTLAYDIKGEWMKKAHISKIQPYFTAQNLLTLTRYMGMDPEVNQNGNSGSVQGLDYGTYPQTRSFVLGINVEF